MKLPRQAVHVSSDPFYSAYPTAGPALPKSGLTLSGGKGGGGSREDNPLKCARHCVECSGYRICRQSRFCTQISSGDFLFGCYNT